MVANIECYKSKAEMIREKIKAGDFFTTYYLDSKCEAVYPKYYCKHYCWSIRSIAHAITVNTKQQYIGCNMIYQPSLYKETFHALIDLEGWKWRYDFEFFDEKMVFEAEGAPVMRFFGISQNSLHMFKI